MSLRLSALLLLLVPFGCAADGAKPADAAKAGGAGDGYLFVTFNGEATPMTEQIHFGLSRDGRHWDALNGGAPVLVSTLGEQGVRDPYILRAADWKKIFLLATDLSINRNRSWSRAVRGGSHSILVWSTEDLVHWSAPELVAVAPEDAGCTWAPEAVHDEKTGDYLVFWASTTKRDDYAKQRIWACRTRDFHTFSPPFIYIEKPNHIIDTDIVRADGVYYRFSKDETSKAIAMEQSRDLMGPWSEVPGFSLAKLVGYEGPACFPLRASEPGGAPTWCLLLDYYSKGKGYQPFLCTDLAKGQFTAVNDITFPFRFRHGAVLPLQAGELDRLKAAYPAPPAPSPVQSAK